MGLETNFYFINLEFFFIAFTMSSFFYFIFSVEHTLNQQDGNRYLHFKKRLWYLWGNYYLLTLPVKRGLKYKIWCCDPLILRHIKIKSAVEDVSKPLDGRLRNKQFFYDLVQ